MARILVTGAFGFIGRALVAELAKAGHSVRAAMRQPAGIFPRSVVTDLTLQKSTQVDAAFCVRIADV
jgi:UDP-glucose 4-epimerase